MPAWITQGYEEYAKRMPRECALDLVEIAPEKRTKTTSVPQMKAKEADRLLAAIPQGHFVVALDEKGKHWSTQQLSQQMERWLQQGQDLSLIIGGPDGLDDRVKQRANQTWSLSALTFPHPLVRVVLAEQLYRAWSLLNNHPYHRE